MINLDKIDKKEALRYLQCSNISPDSSIMGLINECEKKLLKVIEPRYLYSAFDITHTENSVILENCTLELTGNDIRKHLKDCKKLCFSVQPFQTALTSFYALHKFPI